MTTYPIESTVPLPPVRKDGGRAQQYPFAQMKVGESFFVPGADAKRLGKNIGSAAHCWARDHKLPWRFCVRTSKEPAGARCWRLADKSVGDPSLQSDTKPFRHDLTGFEVKPGEWVTAVYGPSGILADVYGDTAAEALTNARLLTSVCNAALLIKP
jgi:hypothetical protein